VENVNRTAVVTGAASGIGSATALLFAQKNINTILIDLDEDGLKSTAEAARAMGVSSEVIIGDVSDPAISNVAATAAMDLGSLEYLFNNAGIESVGTIEDLDVKQFERTLSINLTGYFLMAKACIPYMRSMNFGCIVNNSSDAGLRGMHASIAYSPSKAAVIQLTRSLCIDLGEFNIRVNCVCPGAVKTPLCDRFNEEIGKRTGSTGARIQQNFIEAHVPLRRIGCADEVAQLVYFLMSDLGAYINGAVIPIDGGLTAGF
jgi:meso-butanediol dehydrogenase/(S,S)-butanediol dehydrogenase/diacetyl reductase